MYSMLWPHLIRCLQFCTGGESYFGSDEKVSVSEHIQTRPSQIICLQLKSQAQQARECRGFGSRCIHLRYLVPMCTMAASGEMAALWKKALMEHDVTVVNTFLQISEACPRQRRRRSRTVPATAEDAFEEFPEIVEPVCGGSESGFLSDGFARQKSEKEVIEGPWLPSKAASTSTPRLLHGATPDLWEWDAMLYDLQMQDDVAQQKSEKEAIEHCSEPGELMARSIRKLQSLRTLNGLDVPATAEDAFEEFPEIVEPVCGGSESGFLSDGFARQKSEKEVIEGPWLPSKAASTSTPRLLHGATPDLWEWDAMLYDLQMQDDVAQQKSEKEAIEHCSEPGELMARSIRKLQSLRTLNGLDVPDLWELETIYQSLDESPEEPWLPSKASSTSTPRLLHSATPDRWEWDALLATLAPTPAQCDCKGSPNPTSTTEKSSSIEPGNLETMQLSEDRVLVRWCVDAAKFGSNCARLLSPDFHLHFPGQPEPLAFRMLVGGKNAGFKKARARCSIELKCSSQVPAGAGSVTAWVSIGEGARKQIGAKPIEHNFGDKTCCQLRNGEDVNWDFKRSIGDAKGCEIAVEIQL